MTQENIEKMTRAMEVVRIWTKAIEYKLNRIKEKKDVLKKLYFLIEQFNDVNDIERVEHYATQADETKKQIIKATKDYNMFINRLNSLSFIDYATLNELK